MRFTRELICDIVIAIIVGHIFGICIGSGIILGMEMWQ